MYIYIYIYIVYSIHTHICTYVYQLRHITHVVTARSVGGRGLGYNSSSTN